MLFNGLDCQEKLEFDCTYEYFICTSSIAFGTRKENDKIETIIVKTTIVNFEIFFS